MSGRRAALAMIAITAACAGPRAVDPVRFVNRAPVWVVDDRADVPVKPDERAFPALLYALDGFVVRPTTRALDVRDPQPAANVNALGEVPDSTWFVNRIGTRDMSVDEVRRGPALGPGPEARRPWTITGTKIGGASVGFLMKDADGVRYLLKFDERGVPEMETGADVIAQRLLWACGYYTPEDRVVYFDRDDLVLAEDATIKDTFGNERPMTAADLEDKLALINMEPGKPIRGLVSKFLPGVPIGGYPREGTRADDPNDRVPHENRRDLRGMYAIAAWLAHTDIKEGNTLDAWVEDPEDPSRHYVVHYLVDFGKALGVLGFMDPKVSSGWSYSIDVGYALRSLFSLGLWRRPWEGIRRTGIPGVGLYDARYYDPGRFKQHTPYWPFADKDRFDAFWGAKILIRFSPAMIRAVVEEARYSDPRATEYMVKTLIARQRRTALYWFNRVNPLDRFEVEADASGHRLCFDDLSLTYRLVRGAAQYVATAHAYDGGATGWSQIARGAGGRACLTGLGPGPTDDGYLIVRIETRRPDRTQGPVFVHLARDPATGALRIIGLRRT